MNSKGLDYTALIIAIVGAAGKDAQRWKEG